MAANVYLWSLTAASNNSADAAINWAEGQAPSSVNDSARGMMQGVAGWLKDTNSTLTTGGSANAQTVTTNTPYAALATGIRLHLKAGFSNTAAMTLNVTPLGGGAFGAKAVKIISNGVEADPAPGEFSLSGHHIVEYDTAANGAAGAWILLNPSSAGYTTGDVKTTFKTTADSGWVMMDDGSIGNAASSATTRANADTVALFTLLYNNITALVVQNSSGTPVGRGASAAADYAANRRLVLPATLGRSLAISGTGSGLTARVLGSTVGEESHALSTAELATHNHGTTESAHSHGPIGATNFQLGNGGTATFALGADLTMLVTNSAQPTTAVASTGLTINNAGSGTAHNTMQPTSFLNIMVKL